MPADTHPQKTLQVISEPLVLFPLMTLILLLILWSATFSVTATKRQSAESEVRDSSAQMAETFHAQLVRALREIDLTLALLAFALESNEPTRALSLLAENDLLPPDLLFEISIYDDDGLLLAARPDAPGILPEELAYLLDTRTESGATKVSASVYDPARDSWQITFSRRYPGPDPAQQRIINIAVAAEYFVSSYETERLGDSGLLALISDSGDVLVRRSGDTLAYGDPINFDNIPPELLAGDGQLVEFTHPADNVPRYYATQSLFGFPLSLVSGLGIEEQLAQNTAEIRTIYLQSLTASLILVSLMALLGRSSWQLHRSRARLMEEQVAHSRQVEHIAFHDGLTGLPNRSLFSRLLIQSILEAKRSRQKLAVLFLDLDRFKLINDTFGHEAGDDLLKEVSRRIQGVLRESDVVARLGGDEFILMLRNTGSDAEILDIADKLLKIVCQPYHLAGNEAVITVSIGASVYPQDGLDEQTLTKNADTAMYQAKQQGRNQVMLFSQVSPDSAPNPSPEAA